MSELLFSKEVEHNIGYQVHIDRIETGLVCPGHPDISYCILGCQSQFELKYISTPVKMKPNFIRDTQVRWFRKRISFGGNPFIFTKVVIPHRPVQYLLHHGWQIEELANVRLVSSYIDLAAIRWEHSMDWNHFVELLIEFGSSKTRKEVSNGV